MNALQKIMDRQLEKVKRALGIQSPSLLYIGKQELAAVNDTTDREALMAAGIEHLRQLDQPVIELEALDLQAVLEYNDRRNYKEAPDNGGV